MRALLKAAQGMHNNMDSRGIAHPYIFIHRCHTPTRHLKLSRMCMAWTVLHESLTHKNPYSY